MLRTVNFSDEMLSSLGEAEGLRQESKKGLFSIDQIARARLNPGMKNFLKTLLVIACAPLLMSMGKTGGPTLTWLVEGEQVDGPKMVRKDVTPGPDGEIHYFRITPMATHKDVRGMSAFPAEDGTWGATFLVGENAWRSVQATAALDSGKLIRVYVNGRPVEYQRVARPTTDDYLICIWRGITEAEIKQLKSRYKDPNDKPKDKSKPKRS